MTKGRAWGRKGCWSLNTRREEMLRPAFPQPALPVPHTTLACSADCQPSAKSISSTFLQSLSCLRIRNDHWVTLCAVTGGDNSAVMSKKELICLLTEERRDNLQANVCINMCPKFLTCVLILKLIFWHSSSSPLLTGCSLQHHLSPLTILN